MLSGGGGGGGKKSCSSWTKAQQFTLTSFRIFINQ